MKIYISARLDKKEEFKKLEQALLDLGHTVVTDWTLHKDIKPYKNNPELAKNYAIEEMEGLKECEIFIQISTPEGGTAFFAELGAAMMLNEFFGKPKIYVVGEDNTRTTFYFHPGVERKETLEEVLKLL